MKRSRLAWVANLFVLAYALDAGLSAFEEGFRAATGSTALASTRNGLAALVLYAAMGLLPVLALTPRLPVFLFVALIGSTFWLNLGAAPLPLWFGQGRSLGMLLASIQLVTAIGSFLWIRHRNDGRGWLFGSDTLAGPVFSLRHSLGFAASALFLGVPLGSAYLLLAVGMWIQLGTGEFLSFDSRGVSLGDRRYVREDREIRLVGMMHIGEEDAYRELVESFIANSTIVLAEGVSDERNVLDVPLSYGSAARALGLEEQEELGRYLTESEEDGLPEWPVLRTADLDLSDFAPETIDWIEWVARLWDSGRPMSAVTEIVTRVAENPDEWTIVERDILERRNQHLLGEIEAALIEYHRIVVPWGALHLPVIEASIVESGFELADSDRRLLFSWRTVLQGLSR